MWHLDGLHRMEPNTPNALPPMETPHAAVSVSACVHPPCSVAQQCPWPCLYSRLLCSARSVLDVASQASSRALHASNPSCIPGPPLASLMFGRWPLFGPIARFHDEGQSQGQCYSERHGGACTRKIKDRPPCLQSLLRWELPTVNAAACTHHKRSFLRDSAAGQRMQCRAVSSRALHAATQPPFARLAASEEAWSPSL